MGNANTVTTMAEVCEPTDSGVINAKVAGMPCTFLIDSGAQVNTMTAANFEQQTRNIAKNCIIFNPALIDR